MSTAAPAAAKAVTEPVTSATPAASVTDVTEVHPVSSFLEDERPAISARSVQYDEKSGRYICHGTVKITLGNRLITADEAQITSDLSTIWTQGSARLIDGENIFCSEAIYARPLEGQAFFFGTRCKLKRPGLAIDSDSIEYRWQDKIGVFDGHVLYIDSDGEKASSMSSTTSTRTRLPDRHCIPSCQENKKKGLTASTDWLSGPSLFVAMHSRGRLRLMRGQSS